MLLDRLLHIGGDLLEPSVERATVGRHALARLRKKIQRLSLGRDVRALIVRSVGDMRDVRGFVVYDPYGGHSPA